MIHVDGSEKKQEITRTKRNCKSQAEGNKGEVLSQLCLGGTGIDTLAYGWSCWLQIRLENLEGALRLSDHELLETDTVPDLQMNLALEPRSPACRNST